MTTELTGELFALMVQSGTANLEKNRTVINELNVFPIPDGDTGDNMFMTIESGCATVAANTTLSAVSSQIAKGMLLGARGNSGVILSRIFAGISNGFAGMDRASVASIKDAFYCGSREAYDAVSNPVEGTILTVYREAVEYVAESCPNDATVNEFFDLLFEELKRSLERTPELLAVLKEAGVVDSGGAGLVYIVEGMRAALRGNVLLPGSAADSKKSIDVSAFTEDDVLEYGYCTEFLMRLQRSKTQIEQFDVPAFIAALEALGGESVVCFRDESIVKVHVHIMEPGSILNYAQQFGEFLTLKIENMTLQHSESAREGFAPTKKRQRKPFGIVSVACGEGLEKIFCELGADRVVSGGQSMNPSAKDFLTAFDEVNADTIFVLPNNSNVILTAQQAADMYSSSRIRVIPTKTIGDGYSALSMFDTSSENADAIEAELIEAMCGIVTAEVSCAMRDCINNDVAVKSGDYIGFVGNTVYVDAPDRVSAAQQLAEKFVDGRDVVILLCGKDATAEDADALYHALASTYRKTEFIMLDGGQAVYDFIMIFE